MNNKLEDKRLIRLIVSNTMFRAAKVALFLFLNILIWKESNDMQMMFMFNIVLWISHTFFFALFGILVKNGYRRIWLIVWPLWASIAFLFLLLFRENLLNYIYYIWLLLGVTSWMYWVTFNNNTFDITTFYNRGNYEWTKKSLWLIFNMIIPIVIWWLISLDIFWLWYEMSFWVGMILFLLAFIIWNVSIEVPNKGKYKFTKSIKIFLSDKEIFKFLIIYLLLWFTFNTVLLDFLLPLIIYTQVLEEYKLWFILSFLSLVWALGSILYWKLVSFKNYWMTMKIGWVLYAILMIAILIFPSFSTLFTALLKFVFVFFSIAVSVTWQNIIHKIKDYEKIKTEYMVIREIFLMTWRTLVYISLFFIWSVNVNKLNYLFYAMMIIVLISSFILSKIKMHKIEKN